ncbi:Ohr family peroxiredoxin [Terriglobus sp. TAA 43]|uniref:Ohr family peroxiredoxin n=1 Tax=Terriglobus sp. TAA 43 TaxID=278961 RepID=UPI000647F911|nr:Ohr family peroxiredoxin [Terriglobus sp. TAA 43]
MTAISKIHYTAKVHITTGRDGGTAVSDDRHLNVNLSLPGTGSGTNPEQLLAAGWSACFLGALAIAAQKRGISLPVERAIDAEIDLGTTGAEFFLGARLRVSLPGIERAIAQELIDVADATCPYSKALRGNVQTNISLA